MAGQGLHQQARPVPALAQRQPFMLHLTHNACHSPIHWFDPRWPDDSGIYAMIGKTKERVCKTYRHIKEIAQKD